MAKVRHKRAAKRDTESPSHGDGIRPFWSGTISFGLVSVPVDVYPTTRSSGVALRMLAPDGTPLRRRYFDPETERDVAYEHLIRGYEFEKDKHVALTDEELDTASPRKSRDIELRLFVDADSLDPLMLERPYLLTPAGESTKPYRLLAEVMEQQGKAGIATAVMRNREHLLAIVAEGGLLRAFTLRFANEVRAPHAAGLPKATPASATLVKTFERAISRLEKPNVAAASLHDPRDDELRKFVASKLRRGVDVVEAPEVAEDAEAEPADESDGEDLFETIRRSLAKAGKGAPRATHLRLVGAKPKPRAAAKRGKHAQARKRGRRAG